MNLSRLLATLLAFGSTFNIPAEAIDFARAQGPLLRSRSLKKTPDGETPSTETVCDVYKELEGDAFGICNAFCEAKDCAYSSEINGCDELLKQWEDLGGGRLPCAPTMVRIQYRDLVFSPTYFYLIAAPFYHAEPHGLANHEPDKG